MLGRILIVEDELIIAEHLAITLKRHGYEVTGICSSGRAAIDLSKEHQPDLALIDVRIEGDLNGAETAVQIKKLFDVPVPVVFLTALPHEKFPVPVELDFYSYLRKPITDEDLIDAIQRGLACIQESRPGL